VAELKRIGLQTIAAVLQCSGNGRRYFEHGPSGSPWGTGAAGCALWTGVPVRAVIEALGGSVPEAVYLTATGGETLPQLPKDIDPTQFLVERSIPLEKGLRDCLLAWEMNGAPIPLSHGGPVRLIVPGWYGVNNVKYVARLALTAEQSPARIQQTSYRLRPRGEKGDPNQPSMYRMNVKSWLHGPGSDDRPVLVGNVRLHGVAFSGERRVTQVEVSIDGGAVWHPARFVGPDLGPDAWRTFSFDAQLAPGVYEVVSRATDEAGEVQPEVRVDNERGYGNNAWRDMGLRLEVVEVLPPEPPEEPMASPSTKAPVVLSPAGERGRAAFLGANPPCGTCHTLADARVSMGIGPSLDTLAPDRARVTKALRQGLGAMPPYDNRLSSAQIEDIATYLFEATKK
jgi:DMSO/TMAO reductase YedYZ molybdopterin-dependent catalytic subunit